MQTLVPGYQTNVEGFQSRPWLHDGHLVLQGAAVQHQLRQHCKAEAKGNQADDRFMATDIGIHQRLDTLLLKPLFEARSSEAALGNDDRDCRPIEYAPPRQHLCYQTGYDRRYTYQRRAREGLECQPGRQLLGVGRDRQIFLAMLHSIKCQRLIAGVHMHFNSRIKAPHDWQYFGKHRIAGGNSAVHPQHTRKRAALLPNLAQQALPALQRIARVL